jgi:hypothetical protein
MLKGRARAARREEVVKVLFRVVVVASIESGEGSTVEEKEMEMADETMLEGTLVTLLKKA